MSRRARAKRAVDTGGMCRRRHVLSKPGAVSRKIIGNAKNESASVTRRLVFFMTRETASGFERMCRFRHMSPVSSPVPTARLARFFMTRKTASGFESTCRPSTHAPGSHRALGELFYDSENRIRLREHVPPADTCPRCPPRAWRALLQNRINNSCACLPVAEGVFRGGHFFIRDGVGQKTCGFIVNCIFVRSREN